MPTGGQRLQNFQGIPGGMGGLGGGPAGQALSMARRMSTQPTGADPRPTSVTGAGAGLAQGYQGMQAGGHPDVHMAYNDQVMRKLPLADQQARGKQTAKAEGAADNSKALQEISHLMGPGLPNPFEELQGFQQHQENPFPGAPMPRSAPASIRPEQGIGDPSKMLEKAIPLMVRMALKQYFGGAEPHQSFAGQAPGMELQGAGAPGMGGEPGLRGTALEGLPTIPERPVKTQPTSRGAAKRVMAGQKRGGVAKKALALAKRRKKGSSKRK